MTDNISQASLYKHMLIVLGLGVLLVFGIGGWAATASLSSAVIAEASVIFDDNVKKVQHRMAGSFPRSMSRKGRKSPQATSS